LDELSLAHQGHGSTYVKGCDMCLIKSARFADRSSAAEAFLTEAKSAYGIANINRIIQTFALAMGDKEFVKELA
jgi:hypothetical protein